MEARAVSPATTNELENADHIGDVTPMAVAMDSPVELSGELPARGAVLPRRRLSRTPSRIEPLPRAIEFGYIRSDMRRLLAIAGVLLLALVVVFVVYPR